MSTFTICIQRPHRSKFEVQLQITSYQLYDCNFQETYKHTPFCDLSALQLPPPLSHVFWPLFHLQASVIGADGWEVCSSVRMGKQTFNTHHLTLKSISGSTKEIKSHIKNKLTLLYCFTFLAAWTHIQQFYIQHQSILFFGNQRLWDSCARTHPSHQKSVSIHALCVVWLWRTTLYSQTGFLINITISVTWCHVVS